MLGKQERDDKTFSEFEMERMILKCLFLARPNNATNPSIQIIDTFFQDVMLNWQAVWLNFTGILSIKENITLLSVSFG